MSEHRYEAWRNLMLILASLLVADAITSFANVRAAILSLIEFDKTLTSRLWPEALAALVVLYIWKNAHGLLITLFDGAYFEKIAVSRFNVAMSCLLSGLVIASFAIVVRSAPLIAIGTSARERGILLLTVTLLPSVALLMLDIFHLFVFDYPAAISDAGARPRLTRNLTFVRSYLAELAREVCRSPLRRASHDQYKRVWIVEDIFTLLIMAGWWISTALVSTASSVIALTLVAFVLVLLMNSLLDYVLNFNYFFSWLRF